MWPFKKCKTKLKAKLMARIVEVKQTPMKNIGVAYEYTLNINSQELNIKTSLDLGKVDDFVTIEIGR